MFMDVGMDTGDMLLKEEIKIEDTDTYESLHDKLKVIGASLIVKTLDKVFDETIIRIKQDDNYSIAPMIDKKMTEIDFNKNGVEIYNLVRGLYPYPATYFVAKNGKIFKVYKVVAVKTNEFEDKNNGEIVIKTKDKLGIKCNDGYISILEIQPQGSKRMEIRAFLAGNNI